MYGGHADFVVYRTSSTELLEPHYTLEYVHMNGAGWQFDVVEEYMIPEGNLRWEDLLVYGTGVHR